MCFILFNLHNRLLMEAVRDSSDRRGNQVSERFRDLLRATQ